MDIQSCEFKLAVYVLVATSRAGVGHTGVGCEPLFIIVVGCGFIQVENESTYPLSVNAVATMLRSERFISDTIGVGNHN